MIEFSVIIWGREGMSRWSAATKWEQCIIPGEPCLLPAPGWTHREQSMHVNGPDYLFNCPVSVFFKQLTAYWRVSVMSTRWVSIAVPNIQWKDFHARRLWTLTAFPHWKSMWILHLCCKLRLCFTHWTSGSKTSGLRLKEWIPPMKSDHFKVSFAADTAVSLTVAVIPFQPSITQWIWLWSHSDMLMARRLLWGCFFLFLTVSEQEQRFRGKI